MNSPAMQTRGVSAGDVEMPVRVITRVSVLGTSNLVAGCGLSGAAGSAVLDMEAGVSYAGGASHTPASSNHLEKGQNMQSFYLVEVPVRDLVVGDWIMDGFGGRSITSMRIDGDRSYLRFSRGPNNWFHHAEILPTERMT